MEWIDVLDKMPEKDDNEELLIFGKDGIFIGTYDGYWHSEKWRHAECMREYLPVTHWSKLPDQPERSKREDIENDDAVL
jgi:hypothetical protein